MEKIKIRPTAGMVRNPFKGMRPLSSEGEEVERNSYWIRRIREGSVEVVAKTPSRPAQKKAAAGGEKGGDK